MNHIPEDTTIIDRFVQRARAVYTLPPVAAEVLDVTGGDEVDLERLARCIERDPALTAKMLGVVNSSQYGLGSRVSRVHQALTLLGTRCVKLLVLGFSLPVELASDDQAELLDDYWRHALLKAVAARELSETIFARPGDDAFIAGLLQDIGMLALLKELGKPYAAFLQRVRRESGNLAALELATLGFDHAILSARLLDHWGLPDSIVQAIALPHDCDRLLDLPKDEREPAQVLHLAELLAELLVEHRSAILTELLEVGDRYCGLTSERLDMLVSSIEEKLRQLTESLALDLSVDDYRQLLIQAHTQLAAIVDSSVRGMSAPDTVEEDLWRETESLVRSVSEFANTRQESHKPTGPGGQLMTDVDQDTTAPWDQPIGTDTGPRKMAGTPPTNDSLPPAVPSSPPRGAVSLAPDGKDDPAFLDRMVVAVAGCRRRRTALSLLLVEIDAFDELSLDVGLKRAVRLARLIGESAARLTGEQLVCVVFGDCRLALIVENCDRQQAVTAGRHLVGAVRSRRLLPGDADVPGITLSVGVATVSVPARNFPARDLVESAERCLNGAKSSGGGAVKSIEIY